MLSLLGVVNILISFLLSILLIISSKLRRILNLPTKVEEKSYYDNRQ